MTAYASQKTPWSVILISAGCATVVALLGGLLTDIGPWYRALIKPSWQPPDWLFGPAWTIIFGLITTSAVVSWQSAASTNARQWLIALFSINAILNVGWSYLFFHLRHPDWALIEVIALWLSILALIVACWRINARAGWLLLPYLAWVTFAGILNKTVVALNPVW